VLAYDETEDCFARQKQTTAALLAAVDELAVESGDDPRGDSPLLDEVDVTFDAMSRRAFVVAEDSVVLELIVRLAPATPRRGFGGGIDGWSRAFPQRAEVVDAVRADTESSYGSQSVRTKCKCTIFAFAHMPGDTPCQS
jgi:hypothetical protein